MGPRAVRSGLLCVALLASACGLLEDRSAAEAAVDRFHQLYNEASYSVIYNEADPQFRRSTSVPDFAQLLTSAQRSLGALRAARRTSFRADGANLETTFDSDFAKGKASEEFGFAVREGRAYLVSYKITSPSLIVR